MVRKTSRVLALATGFVVPSLLGCGNGAVLRAVAGARRVEVNARGRFRMKVFHEPTLLGSAGTIHANRDWVGDGETCLVVYADNLSNVDLGAFLDNHAAHGQPMTMMLHCNILSGLLKYSCCTP